MSDNGVRSALYHAEMVLDELCSDEEIIGCCDNEDGLCGRDWCNRVGCLADKLCEVRASMKSLGVATNASEVSRSLDA